MTGNDGFQDRKRDIEEGNHELTERIRKDTELDAEKKRIAEIIGNKDPEILQTLSVMGFTPDTARLIFLVPLIQTAWVDGRVTRRQRKFIYNAARSHEIDDHTPAGRKLSEWLERRSSDAFFELALRIIRNILHSLPPETHESSRREILEDCERIAKASRQPFIRRISGKPSVHVKQLIEHFSIKLERHATFSG